LERFGYKVYSQNEEDGIIAEIYRRIGEGEKTFVEFGVEEGLENNTHFLLHKGWRGLWLEGSTKSYKAILNNFAAPIRDGQLMVVNCMVDKDNINQYISKLTNTSSGGG
jgi:hypothetical protein